MEEYIIGILNEFGYLGVVLLITIENIFPPIPSEVILTFGGFATTISDLTIFGTITAATIGSVIGAIILYWIGSNLDEIRLKKIANSKTGKILGLNEENISKTYKWFNSRGKYAVFFGRFIPIIRSLVSIPAGMSRIPMIPFLILTTIGSLIWNTTLILLGRIAGNSWIRMANCVGNYSDYIFLVFIIIFLGGIISSYIKKKRKVIFIRFRAK